MLQIRLVSIACVLVSLGISQGRMNGIGVGHFNKYQGIQNAVDGFLITFSFPLYEMDK